MPTSKRLPTLPCNVTRPAVGNVMRLTIFKRVDLPAPLRPMMPTTSPGWTSKDTSLRAQMVSAEGGKRRAGDWLRAESQKQKFHCRRGLARQLFVLCSVLSGSRLFALCS